jgi:alpha-galactosidase
MCLSGDIHDLSESQMTIVRKAIRLYEKCSNVIDQGCSSFEGNADDSYVDPQGWQVVSRLHGNHLLIVAHSFALGNPVATSISIRSGNWRVVDLLCNQHRLVLSEGRLDLFLTSDFEGIVALLERT